MLWAQVYGHMTHTDLAKSVYTEHIYTTNSNPPGQISVLKCTFGTVVHMWGHIFMTSTAIDNVYNNCYILALPPTFSEYDHSIKHDKTCTL